MLLGSSFVLSLTSCTSIPNGPGCVELNPTKGWCTMTLTDEEFFVDESRKYEEKNWPTLKATSVIVPATYWAELKEALLKYCTQAKNCPASLHQKIQRVDDQLFINKIKRRK